MSIFRALLHDENGFIISTELVVVATLLVVGLITGVQAVQTSVVGEMSEVAAAIGSINQSYVLPGRHGCTSWGCGRVAWTGGSCFADGVEVTAQVADFGCAYTGYSCYSRPTFSATYTPCPLPCGPQPCVPACPAACTPPPAFCEPIPPAATSAVCPFPTLDAPFALCLPNCNSCSNEIALCPSCSTDDACPPPSGEATAPEKCNLIW